MSAHRCLRCGRWRGSCLCPGGPAVAPAKNIGQITHVVTVPNHGEVARVVAVVTPPEPRVYSPPAAPADPAPAVFADPCAKLREDLDAANARIKLLESALNRISIWPGKSGAHDTFRSYAEHVLYAIRNGATSIT